MSANIKQYFKSFELSQRFANLLCIDEYPVDIFDVFKHLDGTPILVSSFSEYKSWARTQNIRCPDEIKDAKCYRDDYRGVYIILYNEKTGENRTRFSLAHELGHILLGHLDDSRTELDRGGLTDVVYFKMEGSANTFAGNFLAPPILIRERMAGRPFDIEDIASFFQISEQAVKEYRMRDYTYWLDMPHSKHEEELLKRCKPKMFPHFCYNCSNISYGESLNFCSICGESSMSNYKSRRFSSVIYPGIQLNEHGRVSKCPICENEEHIDNSLFCMICGKPLENHCTSAIDIYTDPNPCEHTEPLPGNARFCPYCSAKTTFFQSNLLKKWDDTDVLESDELPF